MNKAKELRKRFEEDLADLQTWCEHTKTEVMPYCWAPGHFNGTAKVCLECDKVIERYSDIPPFDEMGYSHGT